jgi:hypothetical protein
MPGGFRLFYSCSFGILAEEGVEGFRALGLPECATILAEANGFFGLEVPRDLCARLARLGAGGDGENWDFSALDERFWKACEPEEVPEGFIGVANRYARKLLTQMGQPGDSGPVV